MNKQELTETFRKFGASNPEQWAESEIEEDIPQLARFLFLKGAWSNVVPDNDDWIQHILKNYDPTDNGPYSGMMHSIKEMIDAGVSKMLLQSSLDALGQK